MNNFIRKSDVPLVKYRKLISLIKDYFTYSFNKFFVYDVSEITVSSYPKFLALFLIKYKGHCVAMVSLAQGNLSPYLFTISNWGKDKSRIYGYVDLKYSIVKQMALYISYFIKDTVIDSIKD